jgi:predicted membrane chloride channel (bestrophin family)
MPLAALVQFCSGGVLQLAADHVGALQDALGSCEKILTTPIPVSYTR